MQPGGVSTSSKLLDSPVDVDHRPLVGCGMIRCRRPRMQPDRLQFAAQANDAGESNTRYPGLA